ncbi:putative acyltransferase [Mycobacterium sp. JS623]|uniref:GNAT family N-acetyltransferase n=1 Tax=Mycobacterium sp. JS623 TaxID=212767 RepID=UPI0002A58B28|nr:GNAT family N-acetyltransferase [Mycobacterium sp. JS623]AGB23561.1 putative acyltransferase [Mycobacterium sp. JS623]
MTVRLHDSVDEFREIAEPLYRRDPITNTIELTLLSAGAFPADSLLLTVWDDGTPVGAALQTPPYPLACNAIPVDTMDAVAAELVAGRPELTSVRGDRSSATAFADAWQAITGREASISTEERLYRLGTLRAPAGVAGAPRDANDDDRGLLIDWVQGFFEDAFGSARHDGSQEFVDNANQVGHRFVLWDVDGLPVSVAMLRVPAAGVSRIGPVFTPRELRGHGYGSVVTAAAVRLAHRSGTPDVVLFADLANPTSNAIYQRIGFQPVADSVRIDFVALD